MVLHLLQSHLGLGGDGKNALKALKSLLDEEALPLALLPLFVSRCFDVLLLATVRECSLQAAPSRQRNCAIATNSDGINRSKQGHA